MNTDQARAIIAAHEAHDRALANLRNAGAMSTDDPRATEMLESAGDAYAAAATALAENDWDAIKAHDERQAKVTVVPSGEPAKVSQPTASAPGAEDAENAADAADVPLFEIGQRVLVDQGVPGRVEAREWDEFRGTAKAPREPTYVYTIQPDDKRRKPYRAPEYNLELAPEASSAPQSAAEPAPDPDPPKAA